MRNCCGFLCFICKIAYAVFFIIICKAGRDHTKKSHCHHNHYSKESPSKFPFHVFTSPFAYETGTTVRHSMNISFIVS